MKIAVLGAGAMGQLFGAHLVSSGHDVVMIDVSPETCQAINANGIHVDMGTYHVTGYPRAALARDISDIAELVIVLTKGPHTYDALSSVHHLISEHTIGLSLQNGLGNEIPLIQFFGEDCTVVGMTDFPADRHANGTISSESTGHIVVGEVSSGGKDKAQEVASLLNEAGLHSSYTEEIQIPIWEKVIFNAVYNTVSGATGLTVGGVFSEPEAQALANAILEESLRVALVEGVAINEQRLRKNILNAHKNHANHKTSMLVDLESERRTEIETIGGGIEKAGQQNGTDTPYLSILCDIIRLRERSSRPKTTCGRETRENRATM